MEDWLAGSVPESEDQENQDMSFLGGSVDTGLSPEGFGLMMGELEQEAIERGIADIRAGGPFSNTKMPDLPESQKEFVRQKYKGIPDADKMYERIRLLHGFAERDARLGLSAPSRNAIPKEDREEYQKIFLSYKEPKERGSFAKVIDSLGRSSMNTIENISQSVGEIGSAVGLGDQMAKEHEFSNQMSQLSAFKDPIKSDNLGEFLAISGAEILPPMLAATMVPGPKGAGKLAQMGRMGTQTGYWWTQTFPDLKRELMEQGSDEVTSERVAALAAIPIAAVENIMNDKKFLLPKGLSQTIRKKTLGEISKKVASGTLDFAKDWSKEMSEEVAQSMMTEATKALVGVLDGEAEYAGFDEKAFLEEMKKAAAGLLVLGGGRRGIEQSTKLANTIAEGRERKKALDALREMRSDLNQDVDLSDIVPSEEGIEIQPPAQQPRKEGDPLTPEESIEGQGDENNVEPPQTFNKGDFVTTPEDGFEYEVLGVDETDGRTSVQLRNSDTGGLVVADPSQLQMLATADEANDLADQLGMSRREPLPRGIKPDEGGFTSLTDSDIDNFKFDEDYSEQEGYEETEGVAANKGVTYKRFVVNAKNKSGEEVVYKVQVDSRGKVKREDTGTTERFRNQKVSQERNKAWGEIPSDIKDTIESLGFEFRSDDRAGDLGEKLELAAMISGPRPKRRMFSIESMAQRNKEKVLEFIGKDDANFDDFQDALKKYHQGRSGVSYLLSDSLKSREWQTPEQEKYAGEISGLLEQAGVEVEFTDDAPPSSISPTSKAAYFGKENKVRVFKGNMYTDGRTAQDESKTLLHEGIHALTVNGIKNNEELKERVSVILDEARGAAEEEMYGLKDEFEFVAEAVSNPEFQSFLKTVRSDDGLWRRLMNAIKRAVGIDVSEDALSDILSLTDEIVGFEKGKGPVANKHGVYSKPSNTKFIEILENKSDKVDMSIEVLEHKPGKWISTGRFGFKFGSMQGYGSPLSVSSKEFNSRDEAIADVANELADMMELKIQGESDEKTSKAARKKLEWLEDLIAKHGDVEVLDDLTAEKSFDDMTPEERREYVDRRMKERLGVKEEPKKKTVGKKKKVSKKAKKKPTKKKKKTTEEKIQDSNQKIEEKLNKLGDLLKQKKVFVGVDPELLAASVELAVAYAEAGVLRFRKMVEGVVDKFGAESTKKIGNLLEEAWETVGEINSKVDKPSDTAKIVDELVSKKEMQDKKNERVQYVEDFVQSQFEDGVGYKSITEARKAVSEIDPNLSDKKIDEVIELGIVLEADRIANQGDSVSETYDNLVDLYGRQPNLNVRTTTSMRNQAYSTPAPLAYALSKIIDVNDKSTVYDSSAGNGMLLIGAKNKFANELNDDRVAALRSQGIETFQEDATDDVTDRKFDRIIINPPFGKVKVDGKDKTWQIAGTTRRTKEIDHAIVLATLKNNLKENGKAAIIIGSKGFEKGQPKEDKRRAAAYVKQKRFYDELYQNFNVTDHFTVHGDLYSKQGASFPVDVIIVDGRGTSSRVKPYNFLEEGLPKVFNSWEEIKNGKLLLESDTESSTSSDGERDERASDTGTVQEQASAEAGSEVSGGGRGATEASGRSDGNVPASSTEEGGRSGDKSSVRPDSRKKRPKPRDVSSKAKPKSRSRRGDDAKRDESPLGPAEVESQYQKSYTPKSGMRGLGTLVPNHQKQAVERALDDVEQSYGDLDDFVAKELGYDPEEVGRYFAAEQIDALALMIARHKEGKGFINGDQTGIGKGRVAAGMIVYAQRQGLMPVFVTEKPNLYADMVRDLTDIGQNDEGQFNFLPTNALSKSKDKDDRVVVKNLVTPDGVALDEKVYSQGAKVAERKLKEVVDSFMEDGEGTYKPTARSKVEEKADAIFTTYAQMQPVKQSRTPRHEAMEKIAPKAYFILDESHNAGGGQQQQSRRGDDEQGEEEERLTGAQIVRELINASSGTAYLSATYAKRPEVMDLYSKTGMSDAVESPQHLIDAIVSGKVPMQQAISEMLSDSGAYIRRERSYEGVEFGIDDVGVDLKVTDMVSDIFNSVNEFDKLTTPAKEAIRDRIVSAGGKGGLDTAIGNASVVSVNFSSLLWNITNQMLFALKADAAANKVIETIKNGQSPVIAVDLTFESALNRYIESSGAKLGDEIEFGFTDIVDRYLERSREVLIKHDVDDPASWERIYLKDSELGPYAMEKYKETKDKIKNFAEDLPASPIDWIRSRVEDAGYSIAEVTGRDKVIEYRDGKTYLGERPRNEIGASGRAETVASFNRGDLDAIVLNRSGATGISLHASEKFENQKQRKMIIAQPAANIDEFMQMLGRIHRTGQVTKPAFALLISDAPAETRPASLLVKKLAGLNANVTASTEGGVSFDVPDIMNEVGNRVVAEYLVENDELNLALGGIVSLDKEGEPRIYDTLARQASGRMALRPVAEQKAFWEAVTENFYDEIEQLNKLNKNPLVAQALDLQAKTLNKVSIFEGDQESNNPFLQPAFAEVVEAQRQGEPKPSSEVKKEVEEFYKGDWKSSSELLKSVSDTVKKEIDKYRKERTERIEKRAEQQIQKAQGSDSLNAEEKAEQIKKANASKATALASMEGTIEAKMGKLRKLQHFVPGKAVTVVDGKDEVFGVVTDIKHKGKSMLAPSSWKVTISVASPEREMRLPLSRLDTVQLSEGSEEGDIDMLNVVPLRHDANDMVLEEFDRPVTATEERVIGTGNVLAAFAEFRKSGVTGSVTFFTDQNGNTRRGVMMPRWFKIDKWKSQQPIPFKKAEDVVEFLESGGAQVQSPDFSIRLVMKDGEMMAISPRSRQRSGAYTTNEAIVEASGNEFSSSGSGSVMRMPIKKGNEVKTVEEILKVGSLLTSTHKDMAKQIQGIEDDPTPQRGGRAEKYSSHSQAVYASSDAQTKKGKDLIKRLNEDQKSGDNKVGFRAINEFMIDEAQAKLLVGKTQLSKRYPAHYLGSKTLPYHIIRSKTGYSQLNFHEAAHALSTVMSIDNTGWRQRLGEESLKLLTDPEIYEDTMASGQNIEEGWAELVRRYIVDPKSVDPMLIDRFEDMLDELNPEMLSAIRDAHRAYVIQRSRPIGDQMQTLTNERKQKDSFVKKASDVFSRLMFYAIGADTVLHRIYRRAWMGIGGDSLFSQYDPTGLVGLARGAVDENYKKMQGVARKFFDNLKNTDSDVEAALNSMIHAKTEASRAMLGSRGKEGVRVHQTGNGFLDLSEDEIELLSERFEIPESGKHGDFIYLGDVAPDAIRNKLGDQWEAFSTWGQYRVALERFKAKGQRYPGMDEGMTPEKIQAFVNENSNPEWEKAFDDINKYFDSLLLVSVLSGETSVADAVRMKDVWPEYWSLLRRTEGRPGGLGGSAVEPSAGIQRAFGSELPFKSLDEAIEERTRKTYEAYYRNRLMRTMAKFSVQIGRLSDAPLDVRAEGAQIMLPLRMERKLAAKMRPDEEMDVVLNAVKQMFPDEEIRPQDLDIAWAGKEIWRSTKPRAIQVVRVFEDGKPKYYQVADSLIFDMFASMSARPNRWARFVEKVFGGMKDPWRRAITQNIVFGARNALTRDPITAGFMGDDLKALIPGFYSAMGVVNRLQGEKGSLDAVSASELLSRQLESTTQKPHQRLVDSFFEMMKEGIVPTRTWSLEDIPGQVMSTIMKPIDMINYFTGGRYLSQLGEEIAREGAFVTEKKKGGSDERAQLAYDEITGKFGQRGGQPEVAAAIRIAGFLNPAIQILWGQGKRAFHPDPKMRAFHLSLKLPYIAAMGAVASAMNILLMSMFYDEDDKEEMFSEMRERQDKDRMANMNVMGKIRVPFDYGITGAASSFGWNAVEEQLINDPVNAETKAKQLLRRAGSAPTLFDVMPPSVKTMMELMIGGEGGAQGYSFFFDEEIVPQYLIDANPQNPELRTFPTTPKFYNEAGKALGVSPLKVRYFVRNIFTSQMDELIKTIDKPNPVELTKNIMQVDRVKAYNPSGFGSDSVKTLSNLDDDYARLTQSGVEIPDNLAEAHQHMMLVESIWSLAKDRRDNKKEYEKYKRIMTGVARLANGEPLDKRYPDPIRAYDKMPKDIQEEIDKFVRRKYGYLEPVGKGSNFHIGRGKPNRREDETSDEFQIRVNDWKAQKDAALGFIKKHKGLVTVPTGKKSMQKLKTRLREIVKGVGKPKAPVYRSGMSVRAHNERMTRYYSSLESFGEAQADAQQLLAFLESVD